MTFRATLLASFVLLPLACGSTQKPAPIDEIPIDQAGGGGGGTKTGGGGDDPSGTGGGTGSGTGATGTGSAPDKPPPSGVGPQPMGGTDSTPDAGGAAPAGSTVKKGPLTPKECSDLVNKFVTMMAKENHMPAPALDGQTGQLGDVFSGMRNECAQTTTKKQYTCAMAARTTDVWKKCMQ